MSFVCIKDKHTLLLEWKRTFKKDKKSNAALKPYWPVVLCKDALSSVSCDKP